MSQDPRVFFAAERTFLAWVRSGITLIALGFVVAKFGLFVTLMSNASAEAAGPVLNTAYSNIIGIALVILGVIIVAVAQFNHQHYIKTLPFDDVPDLPIRWLSALLTYSVALSGVVLSVYLIYL